METDELVEAMRGWLETVDLVPPAYAPYAPLVIDGLLSFVARLGPERLEAIAAAQLSLDADASADERLIALLRQSPTLHKLGQVVARQAGLPLDLRARLQALESLVPEPGAYDIAAIVERELGTVAGLRFEGDALAEGSVAFVVPFVWQIDPGTPARRGVFKALKPEAERQLLEDLAIWPDLAEFLEARKGAAGLGTFDFRSLLEGVAHLLRNEIRLDGEQMSLRRARHFFGDMPDVIVPEVFAPLCTPRLTAMERIDGVKVTDADVPAGVRRTLARTVLTALLAKPFWSPAAAHPFFHADPHAGNLYATPDGKLAVFDWALTTELRDAELAAVVQTLLGAAALDEAAVTRAIAALGRLNSAQGLRDAIGAAVRDVRRGTFPGFAWLTPLLDGLARSGIIAFSEETALFRKSLLTLTGVVHDIWPAASIDEVLIMSGGRQFAAESWMRAIVPLPARAFGTHVSNDDLLDFMNALRWTPARYMLGAYRDALDVLLR